MHADRVEVSWEDARSQWLVRIAAGDEVVRRHLKLARNAGEQELQSAALKTVQDEGYEAGAVQISVIRVA